jgi:hypothetical protein
MRAGLGNTGSSHILIAFVDSVLHLLKELINVDQIVLSPNIGHGGQVVTRGLVSTTAITTAAANRNRRRHLLVFRDRATEEGKLKGLETQQTLADRGIGIRVELAALQVAEKFVQRIVPALTVIGVASLLSLAQGIVYIAVGMWVGGLRWGVWLVVLGRRGV